MTEAEWDRFFDVDLKAAWLAAKHVLPHMVRAGRGAIVNVSSLHAFATLDGFFPYAAAKSGLVGLTRSLALDYGPHAIRVNVVAPGFVRTRLVQESIDRAEDRGGRRARDGGRRRARAHRRARTRSRAWCASWPPTRPATSPARRCSSTAA